MYDQEHMDLDINSRPNRNIPQPPSCVLLPIIPAVGQEQF